MKPLKKLAALLVLLLGIFAFTSKTNTAENSNLDLNTIDVLNVLLDQNTSCRPNSNYSFFVETELVEKVRGASTIEAKVFILEKSTGSIAKISDEIIMVPNFKGTQLLENSLSTKKMDNGDEIIETKSDFSLKSLQKFETINNSYIKSTNNLLNLNRSI